ncbi:MAG: hypothetical protein H6Q55_2698 [Deltaproteobacteria bacterium]|nr:hypothetical protein [Deltaproteobacteria bacterium]
MTVNQENIRYRGVKGWLLILCLSLTIFDPLAMLLSLFSITDAAKPLFDQYPGLLRLVVVSGVCRLAIAVSSIYAGLALWRVTPGAVGIARKYLMAVFLYTVFAFFLPAVVGLPEDLAQEIAGSSFVAGTLTISYAVIWFLYLSHSRRVKVTYQTITQQ